jgi:hypothetical protein
MFCTTCGSVGTKKQISGSAGIEIGLFIAAALSLVISYILAALLFTVFLCYGLWRIAAKKRVCRSCGSAHVIPLTSPMAQKMMEPLPIPDFQTYEQPIEQKRIQLGRVRE